MCTVEEVGSDPKKYRAAPDRAAFWFGEKHGGAVLVKGSQGSEGV